MGEDNLSQDLPSKTNKQGRSFARHKGEGSTNTLAPRYQIHLESSYQVSTMDDGEGFMTTTLNLSTGGCALDTKERYERLGTWLRIQLVLPPLGEAVCIEGEVVWTRPPQLAANGLVSVPGAIGLVFKDRRLPRPFQEYLSHCEQARTAVDIGRVELVNAIMKQWLASERLPVQSRFDIALELAADLIAANAPDQARGLLAETIDLILVEKDHISSSSANAAIDLYGALLAIHKIGNDSETQRARLQSLRRRMRNSQGPAPIDWARSEDGQEQDLAS